MLTNSSIDPNGLYRVKFIVRTKTGGPPLIDMSPATWWAGVKSGRFPKPIRNGSMTFWRGADLLTLIEKMSAEQAS